MSDTNPLGPGGAGSGSPPDKGTDTLRPQRGEEATGVVARSASVPPELEHSAPRVPPARAPRAQEESLLASGQLLAGRYTVLATLGQGGMGVVLAAYDARLDRRVALKLLLPASAAPAQKRDSHQSRLVREAQAMARLSHPNVVGLYDSGTLEDGRLYLAMEYVEGQTLRQWLREKPRTWREVLDSYVEAGRGLAAVHAAGLLHRDFKPDNVLVAHDGRVRVTDLGLARAVALSQSMETTLPGKATRAEGESGLPPSQLQAMPGDVWEIPLTLPGNVMGTVKYLAPELLVGQPADARTDVFAYCVALYESLYGKSAFGSGGTPRERMEAQRAGKVNAPPGSSEVPGWVASAVLWGLRADPGKRPASMAQLLSALEDDATERRRVRKRVAAFAGVVLALGVLALAHWQRGQGPGCAQQVRERLVGVWDEPRKVRLRQVLLGTGLSYAQDTAERVEAALEGYAGQWVQLRTQACVAREASSHKARQLSVLQVYCLERRRSQLQALAEVLTRDSDRELLPKAVQGVHALPPLQDCTDEKALTAAVPPPEDPQVRGRVEVLQAQVDRLEALHAAGKYREGGALGERVLREVGAVGFAPLHARALFQVARLRDRAGDYAGAEALLLQAIPLASRVRESVLEANAWSVLLRATGIGQARCEEALWLRLAVEAAVARAGDARVRVHALDTLGNILGVAGRYEESRAWHEQALALAEEVHGKEHLSVAYSLNNLGIALESLGRYEEALARHERSLAIKEQVVGREHPSVATSLNNLGLVLESLGRYEEALARYERALTLDEQARGPEHPHVALSLDNLGNVLASLGRYEEALARHERALAIHEQVLGSEHPNVSSSLGGVGNVLASLGRYEEALARHERALALREKTLEREHPLVAASLNELGQVLASLGRYEEALARYERALAIDEKARGPEHSNVAYALDNLGQVLASLGRYEETQARHERALAIREKALGSGHPDVAASLDHLGQVLRELGAYARARELQERAVAVVERAGGPERTAAAARGLGRTLVHLGQLEPAEHHLERARALQEKALGAEHPELAEVLLGLGELELARARPSQAVAWLKKALRVARGSLHAQVQLVLARALWESPADRPRAHALATQARESFQRLGHRRKLTEATRWLAANPAP